MSEDLFWIPDSAGDELSSQELSSQEEATFAGPDLYVGDGCSAVAEEVFWDYFSGSYRSISSARLAEYAGLAAYDVYVW